MHNFSLVVVCNLELIHDLDSKIVLFLYEIQIRVGKSALFALEVNDNDFLEVLDYGECLGGISVLFTLETFELFFGLLIPPDIR